jgi:hypothetical protein
MFTLARGLSLSTFGRESLTKDIVAGVLLTTLLVPQGMAYAELNSRGISLALAELKDPVRRKIERYGLTPSATQRPALSVARRSRAGRRRL